ncbi:PREDICTED: protein PROCA1 [Elephantulus edwardii]|uniref:protein PROCA1 n=1 Tax=Elephantulus edwardii TaxID=28737 RepID=UPI0003F06180|nr:PREDICTED: protein PROCA1 [Elephantulus edwardii]
MWVRTTVTIERWVEEKSGNKIKSWEESESEDINRLPSWERGHLSGVTSNTDTSTFSSEGDLKETDSCCWKHKQCAGHIIHPLISDCGHCKLHLHAVNHCDCDSRVKECSEKTNSSSSQDAGQTCSRDGAPACFRIIQNPCFELIPEEECVERIWYGWCKSYRPVSVAVIHHPIHHEFVDDLNEEEEERKPPIPTQVGPTTKTLDTTTGAGTGTATGTPDSAAPITIWRSDSPTEKGQGNKVIKKVKKKKGKEKDEESSDKDKAKLKKKIKKNKVTKKKSPVKSETSPPDLGRTLSPRELARMSESSPDSREDLDTEDSYSDPRRKEPSSEEMVETVSSRKKEKSTNQNKKCNGKASQGKKVTKRKSPPTSNPNFS